MKESLFATLLSSLPAISVVTLVANALWAAYLAKRGEALAEKVKFVEDSWTNGRGKLAAIADVIEAKYGAIKANLADGAVDESDVNDLLEASKEVRDALK